MAEDLFDEEFTEGGIIDEFPTEQVNRKITPVFFIIDVSGSMNGKKIDIVNNSMEAILKDLTEMNESPDFEIRFAVLTFGSGTEWVTGDDGLQPIDSEWQRLDATGTTYFNTACRDLKDKLSGKKGKFFDFAAGKTITPPVLILLTDGMANDGSPDGSDGMAVLKENKYYQGAFKLAIAIGEDANQKLCENFTGDKELVFTCYNAKTLKKLLDAVIKASIVVSSAGKSNPISEDSQGGKGEPSKFENDTTVLKETIKADLETPLPDNDDDDDWE